MTALALKIYGQMRTGKVEEGLMTPEMNKALSPAVLAEQKPIFDQLGDPCEAGAREQREDGDGS